MKTATIRDVQHHLSKVLCWVAQGEEVQITRRSRTVAKLVPSRDAQAVELPDFAARARAIWGDSPGGKSLSSIIVDDREERL